METKHEDTHINESILSEEILEDQKKNRIDHMTYLPGMEDIGSEILDQVVTAMEAYDYNTYTAEDVKRALAHAERTPEDFQALLSPAALPFLEEIAQAAQIETRKHFGNSVYMFTPIYIANYCENYCIYCGFNCHNKINRAQLNAEEIEKEISRIKGEGIEVENYYSASCPEAIFRQIYEGYQSRVQKNHYLDFDDMVCYTYELFRARPDILAGWQKRFRYILIDEFQDINRLQYATIQMLAQPENNLFIVGDDDQSIYGFRGARPDIMLSFPKQYKSLERVTIGGNYRCTSQILRAATALIRHNKKRYDKKLLAMKGSGELVHVAMYQTPAAQAEAIAKKIQQAMEQGTPPEQIALLFRTARQMNIFSRKFMEYNIPFVMKDSIQNIFEHWVAKDVLSYMKMAMGDRSRNLFLKVANRPKRYLSRAAFTTEPVSFGSLYDYYRDKAYMCERINDLQNDLFAMKQMTPYSAIDYLYHTVGYKNFLAEYAAERGVNVKDWEEIVEEIREDASGYNDFESWFSHIEEYGKQLEERKQKQGRQKSPDDKPGVALMTMHSAKGLEFDIVFIPDANEGMIPYRKSVEDGQIEEERRLMYVAMTRAREHLYLSYVKQRFQKEESPSRFLKEIEKSINFL